MVKKCKCGFLEEIDFFETPGEYQRFVEYLNKQVNEGNLKEVKSDDNYHNGMLYGGSWYQCVSCKEIWRLLEPDYSFRGCWEKVVKSHSGEK